MTRVTRITHEQAARLIAQGKNDRQIFGGKMSRAPGEPTHTERVARRKAQKAARKKARR